MAKGARSNRKKALRTVRRDKVSATWQAEADAKRLAALADCVKAEQVPVVSSAPAEPTDLEESSGGVAMAVDAAGSAKKHKKGKGVNVKRKLGKKKGKKQVGVLSGFNQFHKKGKKGRR